MYRSSFCFYGEYELPFKKSIRNVQDGIRQYKNTMRTILLDKDVPPAVKDHARTAIEAAVKQSEIWDCLGDDLQIMRTDLFHETPVSTL